MCIEKLWKEQASLLKRNEKINCGYITQFIWEHYLNIIHNVYTKVRQKNLEQTKLKNTKSETSD